MIKDIVCIIKKFYKTVKLQKKWVFIMYISYIFCHFATIVPPLFAANIVTQITNSNFNATFINIFLLLISYIVIYTTDYLSYFSYSKNMEFTYKNLRSRMTDKILKYDIDFSSKISKAKILNTINIDTARLAEMSDQITEITAIFLKLIIYIIIFTRINIFLGIIILFFMFIYLYIFNFCNVREAKNLEKQLFWRDKMTENMSQIMNGLSEIQMFNIENKMKKDFDFLANKWSKYYMEKRKYRNLSHGLLPLLPHLIKIGIYVFLAYFILSGQYSIGILILVISYFENILESSLSFMEYSCQLREWAISLDRVNIVLDYIENPNFCYGNSNVDNIKGIIEFKNVSFIYKSKNRGCINNVSFKAKPNEITAIVGHSGSGKTTIINLILRKYAADNGEIFLDEKNINSYSKKVFSTNIIGVNQSPYLFAKSIKANLDLIDKNYNNQIEACKRVGIHEYINSLPKGYETILNENGENFSGGQKQLLAIARVILSQAEVLVFDEITSSLDTSLVDKIKSLLEDLKKDHTIIIVTHKKDISKLADHIIVMNKGQVVGEGTHNFLLENNKIYKDIQTREYISSKIINEKIIIDSSESAK